MGRQRNIDTIIRFGFAFLLSFLFVTYVYAEIKVVNVGGPSGVLKFDPQNITANQGDTIQWKFLGGNHNVVQSDGLASCDRSQIPNAFGSQTNPPSGTFEYNIVDSKTTIYFFCSFASHCNNGMWGIIYVGGTQPTQTSNSSQPIETPPPPPPSPNAAIKFVGDFKVIAFAIFIALINLF